LCYSIDSLSVEEHLSVAKKTNLFCKLHLNAGKIKNFAER